MCVRLISMVQIASATSLLWLAVMSGCASVPMAAPEDSARMKRLPAPPDAALIYLYRNETIGYSVHMDVSLDERPYGQTVAKTFMVWEVPPGSHRLLSKAENDSAITLTVAPGGRYFLWQEVKMGLMYARSNLQLVSDARGQSGVDECELVKMPLPRPRAPRPPPPPPATAPPPTPSNPPPNSSRAHPRAPLG
jgi:hypothetical protein